MRARAVCVYSNLLHDETLLSCRTIYIKTSAKAFDAPNTPLDIYPKVLLLLTALEISVFQNSPHVYTHIVSIKFVVFFAPRDGIKKFSADF
jgi:hypothetical protein